MFCTSCHILFVFTFYTACQYPFCRNTFNTEYQTHVRRRERAEKSADCNEGLQKIEQLHTAALILHSLVIKAFIILITAQLLVLTTVQCCGGLTAQHSQRQCCPASHSRSSSVIQRLSQLCPLLCHPVSLRYCCLALQRLYLLDLQRLNLPAFQ